ncbi:hypothetical protein [Aliidiomarina haloalkalitolerans]|nr:hypothetical protein [Aliidiomarina haloalkalitolerans]
MKKSNYVLLALWIVFIIQILFQFLATPRFWIQQRVTQLEPEQHLLFKGVLGEKYIVTSYLPKVHSGTYFYTIFDAIYFWINLKHQRSYQVCANLSFGCSPGITVHESTAFADIYDLKVAGNPEFLSADEKEYCINGVLGFNRGGVEVDKVNGERMNFFVFSTRNALYTIYGVDTENLTSWRQDCTNHQP